VPKEDYLLKYLEKLSRVIAAMLGFRDGGFPEDSLRLADETYKEFLNFNLDELAIMPVEEFMEIIRKIGYSSTYVEALAQLAHETANSFEAKGNGEYALSFHHKSLQLYYLLNEKDKTFSFEREMIITELKRITS
jgi:hypothetical protein